MFSASSVAVEENILRTPVPDPHLVFVASSVSTTEFTAPSVPVQVWEAHFSPAARADKSTKRRKRLGGATASATTCAGARMPGPVSVWTRTVVPADF